MTCDKLPRPAFNARTQSRMDAFCTRMKLDASIPFNSTPRRENLAKSCSFRRSSSEGADHTLRTSEFTNEDANIERPKRRHDPIIRKKLFN